ncbi:hypothetical protein FZ103_10330 [Streptomonospora sp. PA3]|nr:hypothetical protein [Streptomonospora sp. PA3]MUL41568.1 hypothetical protein [Streptomonospora sp. PA3]
MSLDAEWYELMWKGEKTHEFRRRFLTDTPVQWFVYLTAPASRLCAVIDLDTAIAGTPEQLAEIAERMRPGNGASVRSYLARDGRELGYAMPIRRIREFKGFAAEDLKQMVVGFHPPQGYTLADRHPDWKAVCDKFVSTSCVREATVESPPL